MLCILMYYLYMEINSWLQLTKKMILILAPKLYEAGTSSALHKYPYVLCAHISNMTRIANTAHKTCIIYGWHFTFDL